MAYFIIGVTSKGPVFLETGGLTNEWGEMKIPGPVWGWDKEGRLLSRKVWVKL